MKASIVTIYDPKPNIGNRLQNYAVQEVLKQIGFQVNTLSFQKSLISGKQKLKALAQKMSGYKLPGDTTYWKGVPERVRKFEQFNQKYIVTQHINIIDQIEHADYFVL